MQDGEAVEAAIAALRLERAAQTGSKARETDRQIATLVRAWRGIGGKLKVVGGTDA